MLIFPFTMDPFLCSKVAQLAGSNTALVTFLYNGAINSSSAVLLLIKVGFLVEVYI